MSASRRHNRYHLVAALLCAATHFALLYSFQRVPAFNEGTLLAPALGVGPVLGLFFGIPGLVGCIVATVASDVLCGFTNVDVLVPRVLMASAYLALPYLVRRAGPRGRRLGPVRLDSARKLWSYLGMSVVCAIVAVPLAVVMDAVSGVRGSSMRYAVIALNDLAFLIYLGMPVLVALDRLVPRLAARAGLGEASRRASLNLTQRMVIAGVGAAVAVAAILNFLYFIPYPFYQDYYSIMQDAISGAYALSAVLVLLIFVPLAAGLQFLETHYTRPVERVTAALGSFLQRLGGEGPVEARIDMRGARPLNEVLDLVHAAEDVQVSLADHVDRLTRARERESRISAELDAASRIQMSVVPHDFTGLAGMGVDAYGFMSPAREVGGDFYDAFEAGPGRVGIIIGDVSGKGMPAALFMMRALNALRYQVLACDDLGTALTAANASLYSADEVELFVTAFVCVLDVRTGRLAYANAGHNPPHVRLAGVDGWLDCDPERILAVFPGHAYTQHEVQLEPGDGMLLYTDGVTEAANARREMFGEGRLERAVTGAGLWRDDEGRPLDVRGVVRFVADEVERFTAGAPQSDDITILAFAWRPDGEGSEG